MTTENQNYIILNYQSKTIAEMAKELKTSFYVVKDFMDGNGLKNFKKQRDTSSHPFRKSNRSLEVFLNDCKSANEKRKQDAKENIITRHIA